MSLLVDAIQVGPVKNGVQTITVPNSKNGVYTTLTVEQDKVESFLSERKSIETKGNKNALLAMLAGTVLGAISGAFAKVTQFSSRLENIGLHSSIGMVVGALAGLGVCLKASNDISKLYNNFIYDNTQKS